MFEQKTLTRSLRITIMLSLITLFFVFAPLIIMYTIGYRYDFKNKVITQTGVITIETEQKDVQVYIDDVYLNDKIPAYAPNLAPDNYQVRLQKDNYHTWQKNVIVRKKETTYINDINLVKTDVLESNDVIPLNKISQIYFSFDGRFTIQVKQLQDQVYEFILVDNTNVLLEQAIMRTVSTYTPIVSWSPTKNSFVIETTAGETTSIKVTDAKNTKLTHRYSYPETSSVNYHWSNNGIYLYHDNNIYNISPLQQTKVGPSTAARFFVQDDKDIWQFSKKTFSFKKQSFNIKNGIEKIIYNDDELLFIKTNSGISIVNIKDSTKEIHRIPTQNLIYSQETKKWISWSPWEVWEIKSDGTPIFLNRFGKRIKDVAVLDELNLLAIAFDDGVYAYYPKYNVHIQLINEEVDAIASLPNDKKLFISHKKQTDTPINKQEILFYNY